MKNPTTLKRLQSASNLSKIIGSIFVGLCIILLCIGLFDYFVNSQDFIILISYFGIALGLLSIGAILLTVSAIAEYIE